MDATTNLYNFPMYFHHVYDSGGLNELDEGLIQLEEGQDSADITLAEYTICHNMKYQLLSLVSQIGSFVTQQTAPFTQIELELDQYLDTTSDDDPDFFTHLLEFLVANVNEFIIQMGEGFSITPNYIHNLKTVIIRNDYLSNSILFKELLEIDDVEELYQNVSLSKKFIGRMHTSLIASVMEKLSANFRGSEFIIGFNLCIIDSNSEIFNLSAKITAAMEMAVYLIENCSHYELTALQAIEDMEAYLTENNWFTTSGEINYDEYVFDNLTDEQETKIRTIKRYAKRIIGNSITEIKTKTNLNVLLMRDLSVPSMTT